MEKDIEILKAKLKELRKCSTNENDITKTLLEIGSVYRNEGNYEEALKFTINHWKFVDKVVHRILHYQRHSIT